MRRFILVILALAIMLPSLAQAYDVLVLQGRRDPAFDEVVKGFRSAPGLSHRVVVLSDYAEVDVERIVREDRPALVLAVGDSALALARAVRQTPVVSVMAFGMKNGVARPHNLTGISMFATPEKYCNLLKEMKVRRVGIIHNRDNTGWYLQQARIAAEKAGIELVVSDIKSPRDSIAQLEKLSGKVDALWMLPDTTAVTRETTEAYFRFGQNNAIPVISFAGSYLNLGAAAVIEIDRVELGRQAAAMALSILTGSSVAEVPPAFPRTTVIKSNASVLKRLGPAQSMAR